MMTEKKKTKKRYEVVSLKKEVSIKLDKLMVDIENNTDHIKVTRGQVINYLLLNTSMDFKKKDFKEMEVEFYDLESVLSEARKKVKEIKKQGGIASLAEILPEALLKKPRAKTSNKNVKAKTKEATDVEAVKDSNAHSGGGFKEDITHDLNQDKQ